MNTHQIEPPRASEIAETIIFRELWKRVPNKSFVSGLWLREFYGTPLWKNCFLRVLPVKDYSCFKYYAGNLVLLTPGENALYSQCTPESLIHYSLEIEEKTQGRGTADWNRIKLLEVELKELYKKHFPITYRGIIGYHYPLAHQQEIIGKLNASFWDEFK